MSLNVVFFGQQLHSTRVWQQHWINKFLPLALPTAAESGHLGWYTCGVEMLCSTLGILNPGIATSPPALPIAKDILRGEKGNSLIPKLPNTDLRRAFCSVKKPLPIVWSRRKHWWGEGGYPLSCVNSLGLGGTSKE